MKSLQNRELLKSLLMDRLAWPDYQQLQRDMIMLASDPQAKRGWSE